MTSIESLMRMVNQTETCWLWRGYVRADGYAVRSVRRDGRVAAEYVHRLSYELFVGPIAEGLQLDHLCRTRHCVNPAHLQPVAPRVNYLRGVSVPALNFRKTHCKHGHEFTPENTAIRPQGGRTCRECARAKCRRQRARRQEQSA